MSSPPPQLRGWNLTSTYSAFTKLSLSSAFNESDFSRNYVVIVTTISLWAICVSLFGLCQPTLLQINTTLCSAVIACYFSFIPRHGFSNDAWLLNVCRVSHADLKPAEKKLCICVCVCICKFLNACMFLQRRSNLRLKMTNGGDTLDVTHDYFIVRKRLWTALSLQTADFVSAAWTHSLPLTALLP